MRSGHVDYCDQAQPFTGEGVQEPSDAAEGCGLGKTTGLLRTLIRRKWFSGSHLDGRAWDLGGVYRRGATRNGERDDTREQCVRSATSLSATLTGALHISRNGAKGYALVTASGFVKLDAEANMPLIV